VTVIIIGTSAIKNWQNFAGPIRLEDFPSLILVLAADRSALATVYERAFWSRC
jgi:hypothetical protein